MATDLHPFEEIEIMEEPALEEYVSRRAGERLTGLSWRGFMRLANQGLFRTLELPGMDIRYHRGDIAAVVAQARKPARPTSPP